MNTTKQIKGYSKTCSICGGPCCNMAKVLTCQHCRERQHKQHLLSRMVARCSNSDDNAVRALHVFARKHSIQNHLIKLVHAKIAAQTLGNPNHTP